MAKELTPAEAAAQKKKIKILVLMGAMTMATWGRNLIGGEEGGPAAAIPTPVSNAGPIPGAAGGEGPAPPTNLVAAAAPRKANITSYEQAVERMEVWPQAMNRRVFVGQVEELKPFEREELEEPLELPPLEAPQLEPIHIPTDDELDVAFEDLNLYLSTTALFGKTRIAVINGHRMNEGESTEIQVRGKTVRYEVSKIRSREVEIRYAGELHVLRIQVPGSLDSRQP